VDKEKVFYGGIFDKQRLFISPTIMHHSTFNDAIMKEEIFGPILPVVRYENLDEAILKIKQFPKPLSLYLFGSSNAVKEKIFHEISFGGGSYNDTVMYFANDHLPLGGVGSSGIGAYHGVEGFKTFSHYKSIMEKATWLEFWFLKTPPYKEWKLKILRLLLEHL
ncbi:MAG TPA: aldehyde dehydrogenase, partial [Bacteroidetes bacterium]|nr:aldehyde dehydrogenase [Bacteroidota bacterium]